MRRWGKAALPITILVSLLLVLSISFAFSANNANKDATLTLNTPLNGTFLEVANIDNTGGAEIILNTILWSNHSTAPFERGSSSIVIYGLSGANLNLKAVYSGSLNNPYGITVGQFTGSAGLEIATVETDVGNSNLILEVLQTPWNANPITETIAFIPNDLNLKTNVTAIASGELDNSGTWDDIVIALAYSNNSNVDHLGGVCLTNASFIICNGTGETDPNIEPLFYCSAPINITPADGRKDDPILDIAIGDVGKGDHSAPDGLDDIVIVTKKGRIFVYYQSVTGGESTFTSTDTIAQQYTNTRSVAIADMDADTDNDIVVVNADDDKAVIYWQNQNVAFNALSSLVISTNDYPVSLAIGDVNYDGLNDLIVSRGKSKLINVYVQDSTTGIPNALTYTLSSTGTGGVFGLGFGDLDADTFGDIASITVVDKVLDAFLQESMAGIPALSTNYPILPRLSGISQTITAYNLTTPFTPCPLSRDGTYVGDCSSADIALSSQCADSKYNLTYKVGNFGTKGEYSFSLKGAVEQTVKIGGINVSASVNSNLQLTATTSAVIKGSNSAIQYMLYLKDGCNIVKNSTIHNLTHVSGYNNFFTGLSDDIAACNAASCNYIVEVLAQSAGDVGGTIVEFTYEPQLVGVTVTANTSQNEYRTGETALISVSVAGLDNASVSYSVTAPASMIGKTANFSYNNETGDYHKGSLLLEQSGSYTLTITVKHPTEPWKQKTITKSFTALAPAPVIISKQNFDFGTLGDEASASDELMITNNGNLTISSMSASIPSPMAAAGLSYTLKDTSLGPGVNTTLKLHLKIPSGSENANYSEYITISGIGMATESLSVQFKVFNPLVQVSGDNVTNVTSTVVTSVLSPAVWSVGTIVPGAKSSKSFVPTVDGATPAGYKANIIIKEEDAQYIKSDKSIIETLGDDAGATLELTAPDTVGDYSTTVEFEFIKKSDSSVLEKKILPITFTVAIEEKEIVKDVKSRLSKVKSSLSSAQLTAGAGTKVSAELEPLIVIAQEKLTEAEGYISDAELAFERGEDAVAEEHITNANTALSAAEDTLTQISVVLNASAQNKK